MSTTRLYIPGGCFADTFNPEISGVAVITRLGTDVDDTQVAAVQTAAVSSLGQALATSFGGVTPSPVQVSGLPSYTSADGGKLLAVSPGGTGIEWDVPPIGGGGGSTLVEQALQTSDPGPSTMGGHWPFNISAGNKTLTLPLGSLALNGQQIGAEVQAGWGRGRQLHIVTQGTDTFETGATGQDWYLRGAHEKIIWQYRWTTRTFFIVAAYKDRTDFIGALNNQGAWVTATQYYSGDVVTATAGRYAYPADAVSGASIAADVTAGKAVYLGMDVSGSVTLPANAVGNLHNDGSGNLSWV